MEKKGGNVKMTEKERKIIETMKIANNVVVIEDIDLLKKLSKY